MVVHFVNPNKKKEIQKLLPKLLAKIWIKTVFFDSAFCNEKTQGKE